MAICRAGYAGHEWSRRFEDTSEETQLPLLYGAPPGGTNQDHARPRGGDLRRAAGGAAVGHHNPTETLAGQMTQQIRQTRRLVQHRNDHRDMGGIKGGRRRFPRHVSRSRPIRASTVALAQRRTNRRRLSRAVLGRTQAAPAPRNPAQAFPQPAQPGARALQRSGDSRTAGALHASAHPGGGAPPPRPAQARTLPGWIELPRRGRLDGLHALPLARVDA